MTSRNSQTSKHENSANWRAQVRTSMLGFTHYMTRNSHSHYCYCFNTRKKIKEIQTKIVETTVQATLYGELYLGDREENDFFWQWYFLVLTQYVKYM